MRIGIVGSEAAKFTYDTASLAKAAIRDLVAEQAGIPIGSTISPQTLRGLIIVSGHCHLGGIDIWAEDFATEMQLPTMILPPKSLSWENGYKPRNIQIAQNSDIVYVITLKELPQTFKGMRFKNCYHCARREHKHGEHVKSGGCWTAWYAVEKLGKEAKWIVI
jgi:hypothetical protein